MIIIDTNNCIGCGQCVQDCFPRYLTLANGKAQASGGRCLECGHCVAVCPQDAIQMAGYAQGLTYTPEQRAIAPERLADFMQWRRSIRQFQDRPVPRELLEQIIDAGRMTPTGSNSQSPAYIVLQNDLPQVRAKAVEALYHRSQDAANAYRESLARIYQDSQAGRDTLFHGAPAVILVLDRQAHGINGALAASRMELMANALGLGVCFVGFFVQAIDSDPDLRQLLNLSEDARPVTSLAIGYPTVTYHRTAPRKPAEVTWR